MAGRTQFQGLKQAGDSPEQVSKVVNTILAGKLNCTLAVTLTISVTTTTITDPRINSTSVILLMPKTAHAAAEIGNGTIYVSSVALGQAVITHASNTQADRSFTAVILA